MNPAIRTLIVDDEPAARRTLRALLADFPFIRLEGEAANVGEAARLAENCAPQLVLLDITMPQRSGFELLPLLPSPFQVIVVTAFDDYAVRAFEFHAIDYLLKPIRRERLHLALQRARQTLAQPSATAAEEFIPPLKDELILQADGEVRIVSASNIAYVKAVGNYTQVNLTEGSRMLIRRSMEQWEELLRADQFFRPHRSLIVNLGLMRGIRPINRDAAELRLEGCRAPITVGRRASLLLRRILGRKAVGQIPAMEEAMPMGAL
jgi:two-component system LytT family response regulator